jgi:prepilin-type N-terminal cleavage/methylation domain-containing protein
VRQHSKQTGMTLIEALIALAIGAVILSALGAAIYTILNTTGRGNDEITTIRDIQSASYWISNDAQMAGEVTLIDGDPSGNMTLHWNDSTGSPHTSSYSLSGTELLRNYDSNQTTVAWSVSSVEFSVTDDILSYTIVSVVPGRWNVSQQTTGQVNLRAYTGN